MIKLEKFLKVQEEGTKAKEHAMRIEDAFHEADPQIGGYYRKLAFRVLSSLKVRVGRGRVGERARKM